MKRHPDLRKFSDDHHQGLVRARRLRRTADGEGTPSEEASAFLRFWEEETSPHFRARGRGAARSLRASRRGPRRGARTRDGIRPRPHQDLGYGLRGEVGSGGVDRETLREIGERLEAHIRLEERRVFPMMEASLSEEALHEIGARIGPG
jgi:hypothetical protein